MKKILVIGPDSSHAGGGMAQVIRTICESPDLRRQYELTAYASYREGSVAERFLFEQKQWRRFQRDHLAARYDLFHIHMASWRSAFRKCRYAEAIRNAGKPYVLQIHGGAFPSFFQGLNERQKSRVRSCIENADAVIALSESWKKQYSAMFDMKRCEVVPNGIDAGHFSSGVSDVTDETRNRFLFLGRLEEDKGIYDLLEAVRIAAGENPAVRVDLAGRGEEEKVREKIRALHIEDNVRLAGWADDEKKLQLLRACGTVILPSHFEAMPVSVLEGMAAGKAIVATDVGAVPDMVVPDGGIVVKPGDSQELAEAMATVSKDPDRLAAMQRFNRERAKERYSLQVMYEALGSCYSSVLD